MKTERHGMFQTPRLNVGLGLFWACNDKIADLTNCAQAATNLGFT